MNARQFSIDILKQLHEAGFVALWAGGCVRDSLLNRTPKDYDVATNATPEQVRNLFGHKRTLAIGASFGVISVLPSAASDNRQTRGLEPVEVATFRRDGGYSDGRRPDSVEYTDAREDALRRDYTINGMFFDPLTDTVIDYVDGKADLEAGVIRAIGDPDQRIEEDKLRMLRAVRFAATFGFTIEPKTMAAIQQQARQISVVSGERIGAELQRMLRQQNRVHAVKLLIEARLLQPILPDSLRIETEHVASCGIDQLTRLSEANFESTVVTMLEPGLGNGEDENRAKRASNVLQASWKLNNDQRKTIAWLATHWKTLHSAKSHPWPEIQRLLIHESASQAVAVAAAVAGKSDGVEFCRERLGWTPERLNPLPLLDGQALIAKGIRPGPNFKRVLDSVRDAQLNGDIDCAEAASQLAMRLIDSTDES
jgi:tRNA nucleotidyltransferase/poly(A) polymerase